mmetsp:Transcript_2449/g.16404  ORF Transcript_2449/g.16404 Transcript_2449/m.16404 type:complete len:96 (-) Transcript_2449:105-392(-)
MLESAVELRDPTRIEEHERGPGTSIASWIERTAIAWKEAKVQSRGRNSHCCGRRREKSKKDGNREEPVTRAAHRDKAELCCQPADCPLNMPPGTN